MFCTSFFLVACLVSVSWAEKSCDALLSERCATANIGLQKACLNSLTCKNGAVGALPKPARLFENVIHGACESVQFEIFQANANVDWNLNGPVSSSNNDDEDKILNGVITKSDDPNDRDNLVDGIYMLTVTDSFVNNGDFSTAVPVLEIEGQTDLGLLVPFTSEVNTVFGCRNSPRVECNTVNFGMILNSNSGLRNYGTSWILSEEYGGIVFQKDYRNINNFYDDQFVPEIENGIILDLDDFSTGRLDGGTYTLTITDNDSSGDGSPTGLLVLGNLGPEPSLAEEWGRQVSFMFSCAVFPSPSPSPYPSPSPSPYPSPSPSPSFDCMFCNAASHVSRCHLDRSVREFVQANPSTIDSLTQEEVAVLDLFMNQSISSRDYYDESGYYGENSYNNHGESGFNNGGFGENGESGFHGEHGESGPVCDLALAQIKCCIHCTNFQQTGSNAEYVLAHSVYEKLTVGCPSTMALDMEMPSLGSTTSTSEDSPFKFSQ